LDNIKSIIEINFFTKLDEIFFYSKHTKKMDALFCPIDNYYISLLLKM